VPRLLSFCWNAPDPPLRVEWSVLHYAPADKVDRRLIGAALARILNLPKITDREDKRLPSEFRQRSIDFILVSHPDICKDLKIDARADLPDKLYSICQLERRLLADIRPVEDTAATDDINRFCSAAGEVLKALNGKLVSPLLGPFLPPGFVRARISNVFNLMKHVKDAPSSQITKVLPGCRAAIEECIEELGTLGTFAARRYLLPLFHQALRIIEHFFDSCDATKPAEIVVTSYDKKYPLQQVEATTRLKFLVRNQGPGPASEIELSVSLDACLEPATVAYSVSELDVGTMEIDLPVRIVSGRESVDYIATATWLNYDGSAGYREFEGSLRAQPSGIDWEQLAQQDPYSIEPVSGRRPFIGRGADLQRLYRAVVSPDMGSAVIHGQRRVGKTSLANELIREAANRAGVSAIYVDGGYTEPTAAGTVRSLGRTLCRRFRLISRNLERIGVPEFHDSLMPFIEEFLVDVLEVEPDRQFLIVLDEFDGLPIELYKRGPIGDTFFLHLRAISSKPRVGVLLIGGENIRSIMSSQGYQLNKWLVHSLDYFHKADNWTDFQDLIRKPVARSIEYSNEAVEEIFSWTNGNPYFTNLICQETYQTCTTNKDAFVTKSEITEAVSRKITTIEDNAFQHFWEDAIDRGDYVEEVSIRRRRILLALAAVLQRGLPPTQETICQERLIDPIGPDGTNAELKRFVERGVLNCSNEIYSCRVRLFMAWLRDCGHQKIMISFTDRDERLRLEQAERESYVTSTELGQLAKGWGTYKGRPISEDTIRAWLDQFDDNRQKRLMYQLLRGIRFHSQAQIREKLREAMGIVRRNTIERRQEGKRARRDILTTSLGGPGKSGTKFARLFATENKISTDNVVDVPKLISLFESGADDVQCVVIVDDFIGSGESATDGLNRIFNEKAGISAYRKAKWIYITVCGFEKGIAEVEKEIQHRELPVEVHVCDILTEKDRAFSEESTLFMSAADRLLAHDLAYRIGLQLEPGNPLGYKASEALVVFDDSCPNNALPILSEKGKSWTPLFPRF
jgi:AAA+ ATPase superfamily predicted ATPase